MTLQSTRDRTDERFALRWGDADVQFEFSWTAESPVQLTGLRHGDHPWRVHPSPLVEILTADGGHTPASDRLTHTTAGWALRYVHHREETTPGGLVLEITQATEALEATIRLELTASAPVVRSSVVVEGRRGPTVLRSVTSFAMGLPLSGGADALTGWSLLSGRSDWLGEGRWSEAPLRGAAFPELAQALTGHDPRGELAAASDGTWSTGRALPTAAVAHDTLPVALMWQIEHNGAWRWELGEDTGGAGIALSGPTDADSSWSLPLHAGDRFESVPVAIAFGSDLTDVLASLTAYRRAARRAHVDNAARPVVFNDYMNTLNGDPTTDRLLPLIAAAAEAGAEIFCIDAGWYDDSGHWWDTVGEWTPSTTRFPGGLGEVVDAIRAHGMVPGLWLEPEVVGVRSAVADRLPEEAFLQRHGARIVEHQRFHLDLRHPSAVAHLDAVVDRLVADFGIGFFKFDYNINPGPGTDVGSASVGAGLLDHNRAHLEWLDSLLDRHPGLVIENCASGAMRMDFAMLSRLAMQSTSDQQDFVKYPPIAASAPLSMLPEQAASWAYPQPEMSAEEAAFCLVTGLLGRYYVSGHLNRMSDDGRRLVAEAIATAKHLRPFLGEADAHWPLGLPSWTDEWVALGMRGADEDLVSVWRRGGADTVELAFPHLAGREVSVSTVFPAELPSWHTEWDAAAGVLTVRAEASLAARTLRLVGSPTTPAQDRIDNRSE